MAVALGPNPTTGVRQPLSIWGLLSVLISPSQEALYSSVPEAEAPKAEQDAGRKRRAEDTYITMVRRRAAAPSCGRHGQDVQL